MQARDLKSTTKAALLIWKEEKDKQTQKGTQRKQTEENKIVDG